MQMISVLVGSIFFKLPADEKGAADRLNAVSFVVLMQAFALFDILMLFPVERYFVSLSPGFFSVCAF